MAKKGRAVNRRKPATGGGRPLLALLVVAAVIAIAFLLLEYSRRTVPPEKPVTAVTPATTPTPHIQIPPRPAAPHKALSSVSIPAPAVVAKPPVAAIPHQKGTGRVAIIIDDMGTNVQELKALLSIDLPLTFSVIPSLAHAKDVAESAHGAHAEVMIHMPMEPDGYPKQRMEKIGLLLSMENPEIIERVNGYFRSVPFAVGANNHMGSRFTRDADKMEVVLKVLKGRGMFFVDSRTSPASVGYQTARTLGLKCAVRKVFLDNVQDEAAIGKQLVEVAAVARKNGGAIAICHPHPATIRALKAMMPELARSGITFVHASALTS